MISRPYILVFASLLLLASSAQAQSEPTAATPPTPANTAAEIPAGATNDASRALQLPDLSRRENLSSAMQIIILLTVLSLAPAILIMMTSFTRIIIVMSLLRQALGTQSLPPNQVLIGLSLFMTFLIMSPTWQRVHSDAIGPYMDGKISQQDALARAQVPLREFMIRNIERSGNTNDVLLFTASGSGAFESAIVNLLSPGERVLVVTAGEFGDRWCRMAAAFGADVRELRYAWGRRRSRTTSDRVSTRRQRKS